MPRSGPGAGPARGLAAAGLAALLVLAQATSAVPVATAYILYRGTFGEWTVVCWRDMIGPERSCYIDAPPVSLDPAMRTSAIRVEPEADGGLTVTVFSRSGTVLGTPAELRIDDNAPHEGRPDPLDHATWRGEEAARIVEELRSGAWLSLRFPSARTVAPEVAISLEGFGQALEAFRDNLARFRRAAGAVSGG